jgi:ligand-binding sensor domain-containing protein/signal transduction histidine kinase
MFTRPPNYISNFETVMFRKTMFIFSVLLVPVFLFAQIKIGKPNFYNYSISFDKIEFKGFTNSTSSIISLLQTRDGYIWMGTTNGLFRYDGYNLKVLDKNEITAFQSNIIRCLLEDRNGNLWVGTDRGITVIPKNYPALTKNIYGFHNEKLVSLCEDANGSIIAGTEQGLFQIKNDSSIVIKNFNNYRISQILRDSIGNIWISSFENGIQKYQNGIFQKIDLPKHEKGISSLCCDQKGNIWAGTITGSIYELNPMTGAIKSTYNTRTNCLISKILFINDEIWISSLGAGLFNLKNKVINSEGKQNGLYSDMIQTMLADNENNIWVGTLGNGLFKIRRDKFNNLTEKNGLSNNFIRTVFEDNKNNIWIGTSTSRIDKISYNGTVTHFDLKTEFNFTGVNTFCEDEKGNIWIGTENSGINIIKKEKTESYTNEKLKSKCIKAVFRDTYNNIWIGTSLGLLKITGQKTEYFNVESGLPHISINCIAEDNDKKIIIGTHKGISIYDGKKFINYNERNGLIADFVNCIYCDKENVIWVGTHKGLSRIKNNKINNYSSKMGLYDDNIFQIIEDNNLLWMSSKKGIFYVRKGDFLVDDKQNFSLFSVGYDNEDGMAASECFGISQPAGIKLHSGEILIPTLYGVAVLNPNHIFSLKTQKPPQVVISDFKVDYISTDIINNVELTPGKKNFQFDYSALSFTNSEKNQYRYMLEGYDDDWQYGGNKTHVEYTNLPPGDYTFRVMASNSDGVWNVEGASLSFALKPHFYQSKIFYSLTILAGLFLLFIITQLRVRNIERRKRQLEKIVEIRTRELKEINQTKDKIFSIISHDLRGSIGNFMSMLKLLVDEPDSVDESDLRDILKTMKDSSESTYYLLDNLLNWARSQRGIIEYKPENMEINFIVDDVINLLKQLAKAKTISLQSNLKGRISAYFDKNTINTVTRNLTSNAIKFTRPNGNIWIDAVVNDGQIEVSVNDNGLGISPENIDKIFNAYQGVTTLGTSGEKGTGLGLLLCKEFVEKNGGKIWVESEVGKGSSFKFTLPVK